MHAVTSPVHACSKNACTQKESLHSKKNAHTNLTRQTREERRGDGRELATSLCALPPSNERDSQQESREKEREEREEASRKERERERGRGLQKFERVREKIPEVRESEREVREVSRADGRSSERVHQTEQEREGSRRISKQFGSRSFFEAAESFPQIMRSN